MSHTFVVHPDRLEEAGPALAAAVEAVQNGMLVVIPTETVYGIACRPDDPKATDRVFRAKRRPLGLNLPVLAASAEGAWTIGRIDPSAHALAEAFWPGPLTLVLPRTDGSRKWSLGEATDTVAVRVPDHPVCAELLARTGPLAATSANLSGRPPVGDHHELVATFGEAVEVFLFLAPGVSVPSGLASTVVDLTGETSRVTREGPLAADDIGRALGRTDA